MFFESVTYMCLWSSGMYTADNHDCQALYTNLHPPPCERIITCKRIDARHENTSRHQTRKTLTIPTPLLISHFHKILKRSFQGEPECETAWSRNAAKSSINEHEKLLKRMINLLNVRMGRTSLMMGRGNVRLSPTLAEGVFVQMSLLMGQKDGVVCLTLWGILWRDSMCFHVIITECRLFLYSHHKSNSAHSILLNARQNIDANHMGKIMI